MNLNNSIESKSLNIFYKFIKIPKYIFKCIDNKVEDMKKKKVSKRWNCNKLEPACGMGMDC